jgi:hypothetical protein
MSPNERELAVNPLRQLQSAVAAVIFSIFSLKKVRASHFKVDSRLSK